MPPEANVWNPLLLFARIRRHFVSNLFFFIVCVPLGQQLIWHIILSIMVNSRRFDNYLYALILGGYCVGIEGVRRRQEYTVILVSGEIMKPANIAKARERMTS